MPEPRSSHRSYRYTIRYVDWTGRQIDSEPLQEMTRSEAYQILLERLEDTADDNLVYGAYLERQR